jgi:hypothetical protein
MRLGRHFASGGVLLFASLASANAVLAQKGRPWVDPPADLSSPPKAAEPESQPSPPVAAAPAVPSVVPPQGPSQQSASPSESGAGLQAMPDKPALPPQAPAAPPDRPARKVWPGEPEQPAIAARPRGVDEDRVATRAEAAREFAISYLNSWSAPNDLAIDATPDFYAPHVMFHGRSMTLQSLVKEKRRFVERWPERHYRPQEETMKVACEPAGMVCTVHSMFDFMAANPRRGKVTQGTAALQLVLSFEEERPIITAENSMVIGQNGRRRNPALEGASDD